MLFSPGFRFWFCAVAITAGLLTTLPGRAETGPVTVRVFSLPDRSQSQGVWLGQAIAVEEFRRLNPHIRLERSTQIQVEGHSMDQGVLLAIAGGISPDIIYVNFRQSESYIQQGFLHPLDEYMDLTQTAAEAKARGSFRDEIMYRDEYEERVPEPVRPVIRRKGPDGKEHIYAMPYAMVVSTMVYRKDLFAEAGLDPERGPRTWDEFFEYAMRLTNPKKGTYGIAFSEGPEMSYYLYPFLCSSGAKAVTQMPDGEWRATFDSPEAVEAYLFFQKILKHKWEFEGKPQRGVAYLGTDLWRKWSEGKIGMLANNYLSANQLTSENMEQTGFAPVPKGPGGISSAEINCLMMGLFAGTKDKRTRDAAWAYMRFIDGPQARRIITRTLVENGSAKLVNPLYLERYGFPDLVSLAPKGLYQIYQYALSNGTPEPYGKNCQLVYDFMTRPLDTIRLYRDYDGMSEAEIKADIARILADAVVKANEKMIGYIPPAEKRKRTFVAWIAVIAVGASFFFIFRRILAAFTGPGASSVRWGFRKYRSAYLILVPAATLILMWQYYPLVRGSFMAFQEYMIVGGSRWVGLDNFANVLFDGQYWHSFVISLYFMVLWIVMGFFPPILLAILLQEVPRGKVVYRTLFYLPAVISTVVVMFLWKQFYDPSEAGLLNQVMGVFGVSPQRWLGEPKLAMIALLLPLAWATMGPSCIIYLAALKSIPEELYEAAEIDGAGFRRKIASIVIPFLRPLLVINFVGAFIAAFKSVDFVLAMTGGGPGGATRVVGMEIFETSFLSLKFGTATAMAWILGSMLLGFTAMQLRMLSKVEFRTAKA